MPARSVISGPMLFSPRCGLPAGRRGVRRLAAAVMFLAALGSAHAQTAQPLAMEVRCQPVRQFRIGSDETRFGPLEFVGGMSMTSGNWSFGAISSFRFVEPGTAFLGVADTGYWVSGRVSRDAAGRPVCFAGLSMTPIVGRDGAPLGDKAHADAEGLAVRDGIATASFERNHRITEYRLAPPQMGAPLRDLDFVVPRRELRQNRGFETIAHAPPDGPLAGARVAIAERSIDEAGNIFAAILEGPRKGVFKVVRSDGFDVTDGAFLPGGDMLVLERSFSLSAGVAMRLRRLEAGAIRPGGLADGPVLVEASMIYDIDNMEGLDLWRRADGALMVSLVSDDNRSLIQRNLYLEFRYDGE